MRTVATIVMLLAGLSLSVVAFSAPTQHAKPVTTSASAHKAKTRHHARHPHVTHAKHHAVKKPASGK